GERGGGTGGTAGPARFRTGRRSACPKDSRTDRRRTSRRHLTSFNCRARARSTRFWSARGESRRGMGGRQPGCPCRLVATPETAARAVTALIGPAGKRRRGSRGGGGGGGARGGPRPHSCGSGGAEGGGGRGGRP